MTKYLRHNKNFLNVSIVLVIILFCSNLIYSSGKTSAGFSTTPWSVRMVESEMNRHKNIYGYWGYVTGTVLKSIEGVWRQTGDVRYFNYIKSTVEASVTSNGSISFYNQSIYSLDDINEGRILLLMYNETKNNKYKIAAETLRLQLKNQPRTSEGGFWHRNNVSAGTYPNQMWLDGLYMANPFYAEYGKMFNEPADFDDVFNQLSVMEKHARDSVTGLLFHGWDESKKEAWSNPTTGCSPSFWGRAIGWYAMALVDVLDYLPEDYSKRKDVILIIERLAAALKKYQEPKKGTWYQVVDQLNGTGNWRESSSSCMFVYAIAKAVRLNYIEKKYLDVAKKGYTGILDEFITTNSDSTINLIQTCSVAGLGGNPYRDGSYDYYVNQTTKSINDGKGVGPFILASQEMENVGYVTPPLNANAKISNGNSILVTWDDKSYNAKGFVIQRKVTGEKEFKEVARIIKGKNSYSDLMIPGVSNYTYRIYSFNESYSSDMSDEIALNISSVGDVDEIETKFELMQNYPNPFNPETVINYNLSVAGFVSLKIYDHLGREVAALVNEFKQRGQYNSTFSILNYKLCSGVYFYRLEAENYSSTKKMILLK